MLPESNEILWYVLGGNAVKEIEKVSLSNDNVKRRTADMSLNVENKLLLYLKGFNFFALQIYESIDIAKMAWLLAFIRFNRNDEITEAFFIFVNL